MKADSDPLRAAPATREPRLDQLVVLDIDELRRELARGLVAPAAYVAPKFLYDALGSRLFEAICELPEYYPTRTEAAIFATHGSEMARTIGPIGTLVDLGAGNCAKASRLLSLLRPERYLAVDISVDFLGEALWALQRRHPALEIAGIGLDFSHALALPRDALLGRPLFFYPGSSIGNFHPHEALRFLADVRTHAPAGGLLIGVDLAKAAEVLQPAYDDALGVTAAFNLNLLRHLNRMLGADFDPRGWRHVGLWNAERSRIEMHLEARSDVHVVWSGGERCFAAGERIHTENSYKYRADDFAALIAEAGFRGGRHWIDERSWFAVFWAEAG